MAIFGVPNYGVSDSYGYASSPKPSLGSRITQLEWRLKELREKKTLEARVADLERQIAELEAA